MDERTFVDTHGVEVFTRWWTIDAPRGIVLVSHGAAEHSGRYDRFARALNEAGFAAVGRARPDLGVPPTTQRVRARARRRLVGRVPLSPVRHLRLAARRGDHEAVGQTLDAFPALAAMIERRAGAMSGGEQQMLALARAFAARPKLLLIDELSLGLAPTIVEQLLPHVASVARASGIGVPLVEQHAPAALDVADRAYVLVRGRVQAENPARELAADPARLAAAYLSAGLGP